MARAHKHLQSAGKKIRSSMKKNIVIGGLIVWNLILMAVLVYVWANGRQPVASHTAGASRDTADASAEGAPQEFTFKVGERLNTDVAPQIANRGIFITAII